MALSGRLESVLQHLATSHRPEAPLSERVGVLQASLFLAAAQLPIKRLAAELLHLARLQLVARTVDAQSQGLALECVAAAVYVCNESSGQGLPFLEDIVALIFLPVLCAATPALATSLPDVADALFRVLSQQRRWSLTHQLLNKCATALIPVSSGLPAALQQPLAPLTQPAAPGSIPEGDRHWLSEASELPPHTVLLLAKHGLASLASGAGSSEEARACADSNARQLLLCALGALFSEQPQWRSAALRALLPDSLAAAATVSPQLHRLALSGVWEAARHLLAEEATRGQGLELLCHFHEALLGLPPPPDPGQPGAQTGNGYSHAAAAAAAAVVPPEQLAGVLQECMAGPAFEQRKAALFLLSRLLPAEAASEGPWPAFLLLYDVLEEFGPHLIESAWEEHIPTLLAHASPDRAEGGSGALAFGVGWLTLLWERALAHKSGQVQRLAAQRLMGHAWDPAALAQLPAAFVTETLVGAVTGPIAGKAHIKELAPQLDSFLARYAAALSPDRRWELLQRLLEAAARPGVLRFSLQAQVAALAALAQALGPLAAACGPPDRSAEALRLLAAAAAAVQGFHGAACRLGLAKGLLATAAALLPGGSFALAEALPLLDRLPPAQTQPGGPLCADLQGWLLGGPEQEQWLAAALARLFQQLAAVGPASPGPVVAPVEVGEWQADAERLARLTALAPEACARALEPAFAALQERLRQLYHRPYLAKGAAERALLTLRALLQAAEPAGGGWLPQRLARLLAEVQDELSLYCRAAWQAFWAPLSVPGLAELQQPEAAAGLGAPQQMGVKASALPPSLAAALHRARLCLECCLQGAVLLTRHADSAEPLPPQPLLSAERPPSPASRSPQASGSPLAGRRRSSSGGSALAHARASLTDAGLAFLQCFASTPLPAPKRAASASQAAAYAQTRGLALGCLAAATQALAAAAELAPATAARLAKEAHLRKLTAAALSLEAEGMIGLETSRWLSLDGALRISAPAAAVPPPPLLAQLLAAAVESVRLAHASALPPLLRCIRFLLGAALADPAAAQAMAAAVIDSSSSSGGSGPPLAAVFEAALQAVWGALTEADRPSNALFATFLQALLPRAAFAARGPAQQGAAQAPWFASWCLHQEGGPVQAAAQRLLQHSAAGGARLTALASLHLVRALTGSPALLPAYAGCYERLLLHGVPVSDDTEASLEAECLGGAEAEDLRQTLEGADESAPAALQYTLLIGRVAAVCGIRRLRQAAEAGEPEEAAAAVAAGRCLWDRIHAAVRAEHRQHNRSRAFHALSEVGRAKLRLWQAAASLAAFVPPEQAGAVAEEVFGMLTVETPAPVKANQELLLARLLLGRAELTEACLLPRLRDYSQSTDGVASLVMVAARLLFNSEAEAQQALLRPVSTALLPWAMLHNQTTRAYAQVILQALLQRFPQLRDSPEAAAAAAFFETSPGMRKLARVRGWLARELAPGAMHDPAKVFDQQAGPSSWEGEEAIVREGAPPNLMDLVIDFLSVQRSAMREAAAAAEGRQAGAADSAGGAVPASGGGGLRDLQRKLRPQTDAPLTEPWEEALAAALPERAPADAAADSALARARGGRRLTVVASLLDRAPNLAGLTRTCEVFAAERLVLGDLRVTRSHEFRGVSVSAEQHVRLEEVRPEALPAWLAQQKAAGYALLGLEQTAEAVPLPGFAFPAKAVLLLGREREGIPPDLLRLLDRALVIPQLGVIRSLNAHVSASIGIYEYTRCHPK